MNERRINFNGTEYIRADLVPAEQIPRPGRKKQKRFYIVLAYGMNQKGDAFFMHLKGERMEKFIPGEKIEIIREPKKKKSEP